MATLQLNVPNFDPTNPPGLLYEDGVPKLLFDDTVDEIVRYQFRCPDNYGSSPSLKVSYSMASATSGKVDFDCAVMAVTDGDSQDMDTESYDTANAADLNSNR